MLCPACVTAPPPLLSAATASAKLPLYSSLPKETASLISPRSAQVEPDLDLNISDFSPKGHMRSGRSHDLTIMSQWENMETVILTP